MSIRWESELAALLNELMSVQDELLTFLAEKRQLLVKMDLARLAELEATEEQLLGRLQACHTKRAELLAQAASESKPADSLRSLARALPASERDGLEPQLHAATNRARLLQHQSLANWMFVQRSLLHLTKLLEMIATGGRTEPTYGRSDTVRSGGSLVDQAA